MVSPRHALLRSSPVMWGHNMRRFFLAFALASLLGICDALAAGCTITTQSGTNTTLTCFANADSNFSLTSDPGLPTVTGTNWTSGTAQNTTQSVISSEGAAAVLIQFVQTSTITGGVITIQGAYDSTGSNFITV